jgi:hypothetical protein
VAAGVGQPADLVAGAGDDRRVAELVNESHGYSPAV